MDPLTMGAMIQGGTSLLSSLFSKSKKNQPPQYVAPPSISQMPVYASLFNQQGGYDPASGPVYQHLLQQMTSGQIPPELRAQILSQTRNEAQAAYNAANQNLTFDEDRAMRSNAERMNKMGLLSSGAHGVTAGLLGEGYARQRGNLAANLQNAMTGASTNLMQQEFSQRDRVLGLLQGLETQRQNASVTSRGQLAQLANADAQQQQANAQNMYNSQQYGYGQNQAATGNLFNSLGQMASAYGQSQGWGLSPAAAQRHRSMRRTLR